MNLGYEFTKVAMPTMPFNKLTLSLNISNVGLLWKSTDAPVDPDFTSAQSTSWPTPLAWALNLRIDL